MISFIRRTIIFVLALMARSFGKSFVIVYETRRRDIPGTPEKRFFGNRQIVWELL